MSQRLVILLHFITTHVNITKIIEFLIFHLLYVMLPTEEIIKGKAIKKSLSLFELR